ncbi:hypothetical protein [Bacillus toyonensis]|uniref:hypothetical protein n=1 Tax=Bacillus toyonensis TaxID=155322 RepID=UPI0015D4FA98|nr:hypothetical protein [Bacillus toyonensis]
MEAVNRVNQEKVEVHYAEDGNFFEGVYYGSLISFHFYALVFGLIRLCFYN